MKTKKIVSTWKLSTRRRQNRHRIFRCEETSKSKNNSEQTQQRSHPRLTVKGTKTRSRIAATYIKPNRAAIIKKTRFQSSRGIPSVDRVIAIETEMNPFDSDGDAQVYRPRRSSRAGAKKRFNLNEKSLANSTSSQNDSKSPEEEEEEEDCDTEEEEADETVDNICDVRGSAAAEKETGVALRKSSRRTKFQKSMSETGAKKEAFHSRSPQSPPAHSIKKNSAGYKSKSRDGKQKHGPKSPAIRHTSKRKHKSPVKQNIDQGEDSGSSTEEEVTNYSNVDEDDSQEEMKIQRIIASRSETIRSWHEICSKMNTSEVDNGSRWFQESTEVDKSLDTYEERYLVKWNGLSYLHCSWETKEDLLELIETASTHLRNFFSKSRGGYYFSADERGDGDYFDPSFLEVDRILELANDDKEDVDEAENPFGLILDRDDPDYETGTGRQFLVKWMSLPYSDASYEFERDLIINNIDYEGNVEALKRRMKKPAKRDIDQSEKAGEQIKRKLFLTFDEGSKILKSISSDKRKAMATDFQSRLEKHEYQNGGMLRDYQAEGVSWLLSNYTNKRSCILADEMGLGKTIQTACYVNFVARELKCRGPFLIVAPLSTIPHWSREFKAWTDLNAVIYYGSQEDRTIIRQHEFPFFEDRPEVYSSNALYLKRCHKKSTKKHERIWMIEVVITTPETLVLDDHKELSAVQWELLIVDEAHRLKNHESKLAVNLRHEDFIFNNIVLLTGTPIQNNLTELWALLNFADREKFPSLEQFTSEYGEMKSKEKIDTLHELIRPYILRRLKEDVEKSVPPKEETLIEVELTSTQKQYYRALYENNIQFLNRNRKKIDMPSISNLTMQLRKCCNSAFLINGVEQEMRRKEKQEKSNISEADLLVKSSGKLVLLDKLLPRMKRDGHKLLIFSQFKIMLDIIEDYLMAREYKHERIDGSITGAKRQSAIDRFQAIPEEGKETPFVMLLTTKAGGVGINLTAADTVIIFDSDWNPQNDLQAQARCHRIGQTKSVKIYRLLARKTYEMQMFHMSSLKMGLDQAVLHGVENKGAGTKSKVGLTKEEIEKLLRHGAYDIFNEEKVGKSDKESEAFISADIDSILSRAKTVVHDNTGSSSGAAGGTFSKASFKVPYGLSNVNEDNEPIGDVDIDDPEFWTKMVGEAKEDTESPLIAKKRRRFKGTYVEARVGDVFASESEAVKESSNSSDADLSSEEDGNECREKLRWGGNRKIDWDRKDVENLIKALLQFGYRISFIKKMLTRSKGCKFDEREIKRMTSSIVLVLLKELAEDEASADLNKLGRDDEKDDIPLINLLEEQTSSPVDRDDTIGRPDPMDSDSKCRTSSDCRIDRKEEFFHRLLDQHNNWIKSLLFDAYTSFQSVPDRSKSTKDWIKSRRLGVEVKPEKTYSPLEIAFNQNLLPALKLRGWEVITADNVEGSSLGYKYQEFTYRNVEEVLEMCTTYHPELRKVVSSIIESTPIESPGQSNVPNDPRNSLVMLQSPSSLRLTTMIEILDAFAPLQLLADRFKSTKLNLQKRILSSCFQMYNAMELLAMANLSSQMDNMNGLASSLRYIKRASAPHSNWTSFHDATLVKAICNYGFPVTDAVYDQMKNDPLLKWETRDDDLELQPVQNPENYLKAKVSAAKAAASLLSEEQDIIEDLKGFNKEFIIQSLCLQQGDFSWIVNASKLHEESLNKKPSPPIFLFPSRSDLMKRSKVLLSKLPPKDEDRLADGKSPVKESSIQDTLEAGPLGFTVIDQKDPKFILLLEFLRWLIKIKNADFRLWPRILDFAAKECDRISKEFDSDAARKVGRHLDQVKAAFEAKTNFRLLKNVIRVIVGIEPNPNPKNPSDPNLPFLPNHNSISEQADLDARRPKTSRSSFYADIAIDRCIKLTNQSGAKSKSDYNARDEEVLPLTMTEYVLLRAVTSFGLPRWDENSKKHIREGNDVKKSEIDLSWTSLCDVLRIFAADWVKDDQAAIDLAESNIEKLRKSNASQCTIDKAIEKLSTLKKKVKEKRNVHRNAIDLSEKPMMMAQKTIMLVEAVRRMSGTTESKYSGAKNATKWMRFENGIGSRVIDWCRDELRRWAKTARVMNKENMMPLCTVAAEYMKNSPDLCICMLVDKKAARSIFGQISQQSRLRSILMNPEVKNLGETVAKAAKASLKSGDSWPDRPFWWKSSENEIQPETDHDLLLLKGIVKHGYFGFQDMLLESGIQSELDHGVTNFVLTKSSAQNRIYHLTRELNNIQMTMESLLFTQNVMRSSPIVYLTSHSQCKQQTLIGDFLGPPKNNTNLLVTQDSSPPLAKRSSQTLVMDVTIPQTEDEAAKRNISAEKRPRPSIHTGQELSNEEVIVIDDGSEEEFSKTKKKKLFAKGVNGSGTI